jgi:NAD(P)-dependent dehydrogenase (short-subunit alcohol dehydrogenase family)
VNISGSTVMITGAASGIGKATAFAFARAFTVISERMIERYRSD